ncbi:MAG TPA: pentapeptide repeat-containing protein [Gemmatimonadales bacterium]|jgi:Uncharacterized low-complexity proteins
MSTIAKAFLALLVLSGLGFLIAKGYGQPWTGLGAYTDSKGETVPAKKLWDWLDLLVVPLFLALAAWFLDGSRKRSDQRVETDRQHQKTLEEYFAFMTEILFKNQFQGSDAKTARSIARMRTLAALRQLDGARKAQLIQFLYEAGLLNKDPVLQLNGANLELADLDEATLQQAELRGVYLVRASLRGGHLAGADLRGSDFTESDLTETDLRGADLTQAIFVRAKMRKADLTGAKTDQADFSEADHQNAKGLVP